MAKKVKKEKTGHGPGALGQIMGFSVGPILNRLGREGVKAAHARAILEKLKLKVKDQTVAWNINQGHQGLGKAAELTQAQVRELRNSAEATEKKAAVDKKPKKAAKAPPAKKKSTAGKAKAAKKVIQLPPPKPVETEATEEVAAG